jgi:hypothetical protein
MDITCDLLFSHQTLYQINLHPILPIFSASAVSENELQITNYEL